MKRLWIPLLAAAVLLSSAPRAQDAGDPALKRTNHPRLPGETSQLWLAPDAALVARMGAGAMNEFTTAVKLEVDGNFAKALPMLEQAPLQQSSLGHYAEYYQGLAQLRLGRPADARRTFQALAAKPPTGYLNEAAALREAECDETMGDQAGAMEVYDRLSQTKTTAPDEVLMRLARAAKAAGHPDKAAEAFARIVYEFPLGDLAPIASGELESLPIASITPGSNRYKLELGRAERLFGAKRYAPARGAFVDLRSASQGDDRELVQMRIAECDYYLKRPRNARDGLKPYLENASRQGEALFFYAISIRELGDQAEYMRIVRRLVDEFPTQSWAEEALNNLATRYIVQDDDELADRTFREMYEKYPTGHYAERAAWKIGWYAYNKGRYADTVRMFESGAANFPRSDYRPSWLYWSGRAHELLREQSVADARYALVATDYLNSYYGRLAVARLERHTAQPFEPAAPAAEEPPSAPPLPPNEHIVRELLALALYDQALYELHYAQKNWGDSSVIQATIGWIFNQRGDLRAGINAMKRAYPQYMAAGGEKMPPELLRVLFPVNYWPLIQRYASAHQLDPYLIAALIAQESTFTADVRSAANAYGLMQILPSTGRTYARKVGITSKFSLNLLTTAEPNIKMGTAYFADLVQQFGGAHFALATYNAGPSRVAKWIAEHPGLERDEFIDDIPFPETQNYVKRILGTAEDYRRLYGSPSPAGAHDAVDAVANASPAPPAKKASASTAKQPPKKKKTSHKRSGARAS